MSKPKNMAANREKLRAQKAAYRAANREKLRAQKAAYRAANREKLRAAASTHYKANREKRIAQAAAYAAANPERTHAVRARVRARLTDAYVAACMRLPVAECPPELLEFKREQLLLKRLTNQLTKELGNE